MKKFSVGHEQEQRNEHITDLETTDVRRGNTGQNMKNFAIENKMLRHAHKWLISSFKLKRDSITTPCFS